MPDVSVEVKGLDELERKIGGLATLRTVRVGLKAGAVHVKGKADDYPPSTIANSPGNPKGRWYERGYGPRWMTRQGVHGRKTSQTLGRKWTMAERNNGMTFIIGNNVTYGPYVQDREKQAWFHRQRGWRTVQDVAEDELDTVTRFVQQEIDKQLSKP